MAKLLTVDEFNKMIEGIGYAEQLFPAPGEQWYEAESVLYPCCWDGKIVYMTCGTINREGFVDGYNVHRVPMKDDEDIDEERGTVCGNFRLWDGKPTEEERKNTSWDTWWVTEP